MDLKRIAQSISLSISRAVQITEERLGQANCTQYDEEFQQLARSAELIERTTEAIISNLETALQPNPAHRFEDFIGQRLERRLRDRKLPLYDLGQALSESAQEMGPVSDFSSSLAKVGSAETKLAQYQLDHSLAVNDVLLNPMRNFLSVNCKRLRNERSLLETMRVDLDMARAKAAKAAAYSPAAAEAEAQVAAARKLFDLQLKRTREELESVKAMQKSFINCFIDFIEAQAAFHAESSRCLKDLQRHIED